MKKIISLVFVASLVIACAKYTTPKKVEKRITGTFWKIGAYTGDSDGIDKSYFDSLTFGFGESGNSSATYGGVATYTGTWSMGLNKNPAVLYMSFNQNTPQLNRLSSDWLVNEISKSKMVLTRNTSSSEKTQVTFVR